MSTVTTYDIQSILRKWAIDELNESEVHEWAEERYCTGNFEIESAAVNEVLARLDTMDMNLTTKEDIPVLLRALVSNEFEAILNQHDKSIDIEMRKLKLKSVPLYSQFCR